MDTLIPIIEPQGKHAVSARELYRFLELRPGEFARWCETNIVKNPFAVEGEDWEVFRTDAENPSGGRPSQDYALAIPLAKKLAMMSKTAKGEMLRDYFLELERRVQQNPFALMRQQLDMLEAHSTQLGQHAQAIVALTGRVDLFGADTGYLTVRAYCKQHRLSLPERAALVVGKTAARLCKERGIRVGDVPDERYGSVHSYPVEIIKESLSFRN